MYLDAVQKSMLFLALHLIDIDLSEHCRSQRCPKCSGPLHKSYYQRKPRGGPNELPESISIRMSLCCGHCRIRSLPPSCLFWGRKVYFGAIILITVAVRQRRVVGTSASRLRKLFGVSWQTVKRWLHYFSHIFPVSQTWKKLRGFISSEVTNDDLPAGLVEYFTEHNGKDEQQGILKCLSFLAN